MSSGKSTHLLQTKHSYTENGQRALLFTSAIDDRAGVGMVSSRIGLSCPAQALSSTDNLFEIVKAEHEKHSVTIVLIDEVQFLKPCHIHQASDVADELGIPVMAYGLKNNAFGTLFSEAIVTILAVADQIAELKQLCHCARKATHILKYNPDGEIVKSGPVVEIGGEGRYVSVCRSHFKSGEIGPAAKRHLKH